MTALGNYSQEGERSELRLQPSSSGARFTASFKIEIGDNVYKNKTIIIFIPRNFLNTKTN